MLTFCPDCGASLSAGSSCQEIFESFLGLEFSDPGYGEVHFLTVACFMIQHGRYSDEALQWIQSRLQAYLEEGLTAEQLRKLAGKDTSSRTREWKVMRPAGARQLPKVAWAMTIADVAAGYQDAASYCALVKEWARTTLAQMPGLFSTSV